MRSKMNGMTPVCRWPLISHTSSIALLKTFFSRRVPVPMRHDYHCAGILAGCTLPCSTWDSEGITTGVGGLLAHAAKRVSDSNAAMRIETSVRKIAGFVLRGFGARARMVHHCSRILSHYCECFYIHCPYSHSASVRKALCPGSRSNVCTGAISASSVLKNQSHAANFP